MAAAGRELRLYAAQLLLGGTKSLSQFFSDVKANGLGMEFEFDEALLEGNPDCDTYKKRFREYMSEPG